MRTADVRDPRWVFIPGFPKYEISTNGDIRNAKTKLPVTGYLNAGYRRVGLWRGSTAETRKKSHKSVHRLMGYAFLGLVDGSGLVVRHLDGVSGNNALENLAIGTYAENEADKERTGTTARGERNGQAKLTAAQVSEIKLRLSMGYAKTEIAKSFGVHRSLVYLVSIRKKWAHVPQSEVLHVAD